MGRETAVCEPEVWLANGRFVSIHRGKQRPLPQYNPNLMTTVGQNNCAEISPLRRRQIGLFAAMGTVQS
jgi:hypothetical protein